MQTIPLFNLSLQHKPFQKDLVNIFQKIVTNSAFTHGQETEQFEQHFAELCGTKYAVGMRSGTASLIVSLLALGIGPGDEVITTPATFTATADAIVLVGAKPVFVDVLPENGNIDSKKIEQAVTKKTRAVLVVHLYGIPCDMAKIIQICKKNKLLLIEDASHAHGSVYKKKPVGSFGDVGCFSLYPSKTLGAIGNAGVITTQSKKLAQKNRIFAEHGIKNHEQKYTHYVSGYNELIDNLQAAVLDYKLQSLPQWIARRRKIAKSYNQTFQRFDHPGMKWSKEVEPSLYLYAVQMKKRKQFQEFMKKNGIQTGIYYPTPLHLQPSFQWLGYKRDDFPAAEQFFNQTVSLPLYPELTDQQVEYISQSIESYFKLR